jgi:hypothetical protein
LNRPNGNKTQCCSMPCRDKSLALAKSKKRRKRQP